MAKCGDAPSGTLNLGSVDFNRDNTGLVAGLGDDLAPGGYRKARAEGLTPAFMQAPLSGCKDEAPGLDRSSAQQHMPMRFTRQFGESRGHSDEVRARQRQGLVESGKAHVIADGEPEETP